MTRYYQEDIQPLALPVGRADPELLAHYIDNFYGFGSYQSRYWFIGVEEGSDKSLEENAARLEAWNRRGREELEELIEYHLQISVSRYFSASPPMQPTWNKLVRVLLAIQGHEATHLEVKAYQRDHLGRKGGDTCLLELLPLPSLSVSQLMHGEQRTRHHLNTRDDYREHYAPQRAEHLASRVAYHKPAAVIFYSMDAWYRRWWEMIAGVEFFRVPLRSETLFIADNGHTFFAIIKHPTVRGLTNDYFHEAGAIIRSMLRRTTGSANR